MNLDDLKQLLPDSGWMILVIYFMYKEVWPLITNKLIPASIKNMEAQRIEHASELEADRSFHRQMETERAKTLTAISEAIQNLSIAMTQTNERIASLLANQQLIISRQDSTFAVLTDAIGDMKEAAAKSHKSS